MPSGSSCLWEQWGAAVSQTGGTGRWVGSGDGRRVDVTPADGSSPHRPILSPPRPADGGATCGDRQGAAAAPPEPSHRQRSVTSAVSLLVKVFELSGSRSDKTTPLHIACIP